MYCCASAAIHRRAPAGLSPQRLRCSAPRTAPLIRESVHPCTAQQRSFASTLVGREHLLLLLRQATAGMPEVEQRREQLPDAAKTGPPVARRACGGKSPKGGAQEARQFAVRTGMCGQRTAGARSRTWRAGDGRDAGGRATQEQLPDARKARHRGWPSLWLLSLGHTRESDPLARRASGSFALHEEKRQTSFAQAKKVTRSPAGRVEALHFTKKNDRPGWTLV